MFKNPNYKKNGVKILPSLDLAHSEVFSPSPSSILQIHVEKLADREVVSVISDIEALLMQQSYVLHHPELFEDYIKQAAQRVGKPDVLSGIKEKLSDSDLMQFIKSRRLQTNSELKLYTDMLLEQYNYDYNAMSDYIKGVIDENKQPIESPQEVTTSETSISK